ncbi:MAG: hypothetical protein FWD05_05710 [Oscillospiraceae bacterium]|nr:hypothetical protein [Oscillospiraceae bacterium]
MPIQGINNKDFRFDAVGRYLALAMVDVYNIGDIVYGIKMKKQIKR